MVIQRNEEENLKSFSNDEYGEQNTHHFQFQLGNIIIFFVQFTHQTKNHRNPQNPTLLGVPS